MLRFMATVHKELLLLRRDWVGLLVLFVMPAVLVIVITLVQDNAMKTMGQSGTDILCVDDDQDQLGARIETALEAFEGIRLVKTINGKMAGRDAALAAIGRGDFQVGLIIPAKMTETVRAAARRSALQALSMKNNATPAGQADARLEVYFDPAVPGVFRTTVKSRLELLIFRLQVQEQMAILSELLPVKMRSTLEEALQPMGLDLPDDFDARLNLNWDQSPLIAVHEDPAVPWRGAPIPNAVQQNVPAWSLFGIFFIVLPLAGSFIKERLCGAQRRMLSMPVSYFTITMGKVSAYMLVCCVQYGLILFIGRWLLPLLGTSRFQIGAAPASLALVALSAVLAATAYGILLGTVVNSYEQASMFGPTSVVIAAALGGIMVPVYAMPPLMQKLSLMSPLGWAQNAFLRLLIRGGGIDSVKGDIFALLAFALACIAFAMGIFLRKYHRGKV